MSRGRVGSSLLSFALLIHANWTWHSSSRLPVVFSWSTTNNYNQQFNIRQPRSLSKQYLVVGAAETTTTTTTTTTRIHRDDEHPPVDPIVGLYVHIPFCRRRCRYCNFAIVPIGTRVATESDMDDNDDGNDDNGFRRMNQNYTDAILKELHVLAQQQGPKDSSSKIHLASIYFGGGTPSLAPVKTLQTILFAILDDDNSPFTVDRDNCEITMEMDPGTFSETKLRKIKDIGFNRISLGVQSFDDKILEAIGRVHRKTDIQKSIILLQNVFGDRLNYSVDLISGLPSMSPADWVETLQMVVSLDPQPQHLSLYDLQIEEVRCEPKKIGKNIGKMKGFFFFFFSFAFSSNSQYDI
jgi:oxygen-independent coproporphyrinogen-3 oxidase